MTEITAEDRRRDIFIGKSDAYVIAYLDGEAKWRAEDAARKAGSDIRADNHQPAPLPPPGGYRTAPGGTLTFRTDAAPTAPRSGAQAARHRFMVEQNGVPQQRADVLCRNVDVAEMDRYRADAAAFEASLRADKAAYEERRFAKSTAEKARLRMAVRQDIESRGADGFSLNTFRPTAAVHYDAAPPPPPRTTSAAEARARIYGRGN